MSQLNGEELLTDLDTYISESTSADAEAETALPFETLDEYNTDPLGFGDVTARLLEKVNTVFGLAVKYNRHSPDYLKSCAQLEKGIKYLGSSCLQKYALEQKKHFFPELGQLNTTNLYTMASIQFQKIDRALSEYIEEKHAVDDALLDMEFRYYHLMERIRSTEVKIRNYNEKRWHDREDYTPVIHGLAFSDKSWTKSLHEHDEAPAFQLARAFSENFAYNNVTAALTGQREKGLSLYGTVAEKTVLDDGAGCAEQLADQAFDSNVPDTPALTGQSHEGTVLDDGANNSEEEEDDLAMITEPNFSPSSIIMSQVIARSAEAGDGMLSFTEDEIRILLSDPEFCEYRPQLAAQMREALAAFDSG